MSITDACRVYCVSYRSLRTHCSRKPNYQRRIKQAEEIRFNRRHEEALQSIIRAGEKNWMAHAWYLERVLPNLYALKNVIRTNTDPNQNVIGDKVSEEDLKRYAGLMAEFQIENQAVDSLPERTRTYETRAFERPRL